MTLWQRTLRAIPIDRLCEIAVASGLYRFALRLARIGGLTQQIAVDPEKRCHYYIRDGYIENTTLDYRRRPATRLLELHKDDIYLGSFDHELASNEVTALVAKKG